LCGLAATVAGAASLASAGSFCLGALFPVLMILLSPAGQIARVTAVMAVS